MQEYVLKLLDIRTNTQTDKHTNKQTHRQTNTQTDKHTYKETHRQIDREKATSPKPQCNIRNILILTELEQYSIDPTHRNIHL